MKKIAFCLVAALFLAGCSSNSSTENTASSSSSAVKASSSAVKSSSKASGSKVSKLGDQESTSVSSVTDDNDSQASGEAEEGAKSQNQSNSDAQASNAVSQESVENVGMALMNGDFSSVAGVWQDEFGNQLVVDAAGNVHVEMAAGEHIPEIARENLTRDLFVSSFVSWDGTVYSGSMSNVHHTSGLPNFMVNPSNGTVRLVNPYGETYTGIFTQVE